MIQWTRDLERGKEIVLDLMVKAAMLAVIIVAIPFATALVLIGWWYRKPETEDGKCFVNVGK